MYKGHLSVQRPKVLMEIPKYPAFCDRNAGYDRDVLSIVSVQQWFSWQPCIKAVFCLVSCYPEWYFVEILLILWKYLDIECILDAVMTDACQINLVHFQRLLNGPVLVSNNAFTFSFHKVVQKRHKLLFSLPKKGINGHCRVIPQFWMYEQVML